MRRFLRVLFGHLWMPLLVVIVFVVVPHFVYAQGAADPMPLLEQMRLAIFGPGTTPDLMTVIGKLIAWALGLIATIFFGLMLYAGWLWMTARGEAENVEKAQSIMVQATIGVIIIALAYAITTFVTTSVTGALH